MATKYTAFVWPPLVFPNPTQPTGNGGTQVPAPAPNQVAPTAPAASVNFQAAAAQPNTTAYVNSATTQKQINAFFGIAAYQNGSYNP